MIKAQVKDIFNLSQSRKDLLYQMFLFEGESRPSAAEALKHPWFDVKENYYKRVYKKYANSRVQW